MNQEYATHTTAGSSAGASSVPKIALVVKRAAAWRKALELSLSQQKLDEDFNKLANDLVSFSKSNVPQTYLELQLELNSDMQAAGAQSMAVDVVSPILEEIYYDDDKNASIWRIEEALRDWDDKHRPATGPKTKKTGEKVRPEVTKTTDPAPAKKVAFTKTNNADPGVGASTKGKGKEKAPAAPQPRALSKSVPRPPPSPPAVKATKRKLAESDDSTTEDPAPKPSVPAPPKKKRILSAQYVEDSDDVQDEGDDLGGVAGVNPYPCKVCVGRKEACEWLLDTTKNACRLCVLGKVKCSTMAENREALREERKALHGKKARIIKPSSSSVPEQSAQDISRPKPVPKVVPRVLAVKVGAPGRQLVTKPPGPPPVVKLAPLNRPDAHEQLYSQVDVRIAADTAAADAIDARTQQWEKKFAGEFVDLFLILNFF